VNPSRDLPPDEVHLWITFAEDVREPSLLEQYRRLSTEEERRQEERFRVADDRRRYLIARALVRTVLSRYAPLRPDEWSFATNPHGRPHVANTDVAARGLVFNLSHTRDVIVLGVTRERAVGVDVEHQDRTVSQDVAKRFFSSEEVTALHALPAERRAARLLQHWTLKEAYIKARGMGLAIPVRKLAFDLGTDARIDFTTTRDVDDDPQRWQFWQLRVSEYVVAVCVERSRDAAPRLIPRRIVPLETDAVLECAMLRTSPG
jgi:4'-phosphopantetheinyl transferase